MRIDGGGGGSSFYAAETAQVTAGGRALSAQASAVGNARRYDALGGTGEAAGVEQAAAEFRSLWSGPLDAWQQSLNSLGAATVESGAAMVGTDESGHAAFTAMADGMGQ